MLLVPDDAVELLDAAGGHLGWGVAWDPESADADAAIEYARGLTDDAELTSFEAQERAGKGRVTVLRAIADRREDLAQ